MVVVEHGGRMLETYINASFTERAELTLQLVALMKQLWVTNLRRLLYDAESLSLR